MDKAQPYITAILLLLAAGFLVANAKLIFEYALFVRRRRATLLSWSSTKPPYYGMSLAIGVILGFLVFYKLVVIHRQAYGETMMFVYYGYLTPLSRRIKRGFYDDGIWTDTVFIPYNEIGGLSWRESEHDATLAVSGRVPDEHVVVWRDQCFLAPGGRQHIAQVLGQAAPVECDDNRSIALHAKYAAAAERRGGNA